MDESDVIGEGTYGCIHKPSLECSGQKSIDYTNKVSKVIDSKHGQSELKEYNNISKIDVDSKYYMGVPIKCRLKNTKKNKMSIDKCENVKLKKAFQKNISSLSLLIMDDGGINLKEFAKANRDNGDNTEMELFFIELQRIFHGLLVFNQHKLLHYDLKPQNMVYNSNNHRVNLIDFGHMRTLTKALNESSKSKNHLSVFHWSYPFESFFLNKANYNYFLKYSESEKVGFYQTILQKTKDLQRISGGEGTRKQEKSIRAEIVNFDEVADEIVGFLGYITTNVSSEQVMRITDEYMQDFYNLLMFVIVPNEYNNFVKKSLNTMDSYGLGFSIIYILNNIGPRMKNKDFINQMHILAYNMTTPDLRKRILIEDALTEYTNILNNSGLLTKYGASPSIFQLTTDPYCPPSKKYNATKKKCVKK